MNLKELKNYFDIVIIDKYNKEIDYLNEQIFLYKQIIEDLEQNKISKIAQKVIYEKYRYELTKYNAQIFLKTIKTDLNILKRRLSIYIEKRKKCRLVVNCLEYKQIIYNYLMDFIKEELSKENIVGVELIKTFEEIKKHNLMIRFDEKISTYDLSQVSNMLNMGFEDIEIKYIEVTPKVKQQIKQIINLLDSNSFTSVMASWELQYFSLEEQDYILKVVLKHYQDKIEDLINILKDEEFYFDIETLKTIKKEYQVYLERYLFVRNNLDNIKENKEENNIDNTNYLEPLVEITQANNLYYATNEIEPEKSYFVRDLLKIREESLERILELINNFKNGDISKVKYLANETPSFELKDDQIRIILKHIKNNNYSVMGVFIKKSDNNRSAYNNILARPLASIDDEYSREVENYYMDYIENNKRSGSRK